MASAIIAPLVGFCYTALFLKSVGFKGQMMGRLVLALLDRSVLWELDQQVLEKNVR